MHLTSLKGIFEDKSFDFDFDFEFEFELSIFTTSSSYQATHVASIPVLSVLEWKRV